MAEDEIPCCIVCMERPPAVQGMSCSHRLCLICNQSAWILEHNCCPYRCPGVWKSERSAMVFRTGTLERVATIVFMIVSQLVMKLTGDTSVHDYAPYPVSGKILPGLFWAIRLWIYCVLSGFFYQRFFWRIQFRQQLCLFTCYYTFYRSLEALVVWRFVSTIPVSAST